MTAAPGQTLPSGTQIRRLALHVDERGGVTEAFRIEWVSGLDLVQWTTANSRAGVLRGVHVHRRHTDYVVVVQGRASVGLRDLRPGSPTEGIVASIDMDGRNPAALIIPPGVAHGFYFYEPSVHLNGMSHSWDPSDDLACRWDDPDLGIDWPTAAPILSERDAAAPPLSALVGRVPRYLSPGDSPPAAVS